MNKKILSVFAGISTNFAICDAVFPLDYVDGKLCAIIAAIFFTGMAICSEIEKSKK